MAVGVGALIVAVVAPAWGCVAGLSIRLYRELVAPGEELEVSITVFGTPRPPMMAIRSTGSTLRLCLPGCRMRPR